MLDGLEATRRIKSRWPEARVVVLTLCASYRAQATAVGADVFLVKGCPSKELVRTMTGQPEPRNEQGGGLGQETSSNIPPHPS